MAVLTVFTHPTRSDSQNRWKYFLHLKYNVILCFTALQPPMPISCEFAAAVSRSRRKDQGRPGVTQSCMFSEGHGKVWIQFQPLDA